MIQNKYFANITTMCLALDINHGTGCSPGPKCFGHIRFYIKVPAASAASHAASGCCLSLKQKSWNIRIF